MKPVCVVMHSMVIAVALLGSQASAQSNGAYLLLNELVAANRDAFFVYKNHDSGANKAYPSGIFPSDQKLKIDAACVDDPNNTTTGCAIDPIRIDCEHGTVFRVTWSAMLPAEFFGLNFEEPENYGSRSRGTGYDLRPATQLVFRYRSPTGISVQFGVNDGKISASGTIGASTDFIQIPASRTWTEMRIPLSSLMPSPPDLSNVHIPFFVVTDGKDAPNGGTLLLDDIRIEPVPSRQDTVPSFLLANQTCGVIPAPDKIDSRVTIPPDQVNRNLTTTYESSLALWALLRRGTAQDLANSRRVADAFVYALGHDNTGFPLPKATDGSAGVRNAYIDGDLPFANDQQCPGSATCADPTKSTGAKQGESRLAGFGIGSTLCGESKFCLVLDGGTGGNNAFAIIALLTAYHRIGDVAYVNAARTIATWIHGSFLDGDAEGFGGYFVGYPDEGQKKVVILGKSVENNADIAAAFQMLADVESELCNRTQAETWVKRSRIAGDFVMRMFEPVTGHFYAGTTQAGIASSAGIHPDGPQRGKEAINTTDFLDTNTFVPLAMISLPYYRAAIDWRRPVDWASKQVQHIQAGGQAFQGFNIVQQPVAGPTGIAWEFTGQMVATMRAIDALYGENRFGSQADLYLAQIQLAQTKAPFADGRGLVASTMDGGDQIPPYQQCLSTPFQCIAERVGLAATLWAIFAEKSLNPLARGAINFDALPAYVNAASFNGCLSPGGLFSLFEVPAADQTATAKAFPLPPTLGDAQVLFANRPAPLLYTSPTLINGQVPYEVVAGTADAQLLVGGAKRSQASVKIGSAAPGIFLSDPRRCVAFNFSGGLNSLSNPTPPGDGFTVYMTGIGPVQNPVATGAPAPSDKLSPAISKQAATVGSLPAEILFLGLTPTTAGVGQANLRPSSSLAPGDYEVSIALDGVPTNTCIVSIGSGSAYPAPTISSVTPNSGLAVGGTKVTIRGSGYWGSGMTVKFGSALAPEIFQVDGSTLVAFAPPGSGVVNVTVISPDSRSASATQAFTYKNPAPALFGVLPSSGSIEGGTEVTLSGAFLRGGTSVRFGNAAATNVVVNDSQTISATTPAGSGPVSVTVLNPDGQTFTLPNAFTYKVPIAPNPTLTSTIQKCQVLGSVTGIDPPDGFRIVLYVETNQFYLQPCVTDSLPAVDHVSVFAVTGPVGRLSGCDVARCSAR